MVRVGMRKGHYKTHESYKTQSSTSLEAETRLETYEKV